MDCSPPGSSVHGILQARILEWIAISFSGGLSKPGIKPGSPALQADSLSTELQGKPVLPLNHQECPTTMGHSCNGYFPMKFPLLSWAVVFLSIQENSATSTTQGVQPDTAWWCPGKPKESNPQQATLSPGNPPLMTCCKSFSWGLMCNRHMGLVID